MNQPAQELHLAVPFGHVRGLALDAATSATAAGSSRHGRGLSPDMARRDSSVTEA
jgi:hypothetical protein